MQKVAKKYALKSYFKSVMYNYNYPQNPKEFIRYFLDYQEIPVKDLDANTDKDWFYKMIVEYQKRNGVYASQFFTPPKTAERMAELANDYVIQDETVLDACCGFGQITKYLKLRGFESICGFDISYEMHEYYKTFEKQPCENVSIVEYQVSEDEKFKLIVSNPPYEAREMTEFFEEAKNWLQRNGILIVLVPKNYLEKRTPARFFNAMTEFAILHREDMEEEFFNTKVKAEIVVLTKY